MTHAILRHAAVLMLAPISAAAHPHVFVDASATFVMDADGKLAAVHIEHLYDPLVSLYVLHDFGVDPFSALSKEDATRLGAEQSSMLNDNGGFAALTIGAEETPLGAPSNLVVSIRDERMRVTYTAPLATPGALDDKAATLAIFDPVHFIAFELTGAVSVKGAGNCEAVALEWAPTDGLYALQSTLLELALDETPEDPSVGRMFAAEAQLTCR